MPTTARVAVALLALLLPTTACGEDIVDVSTTECASGRKWVGGNSGSSLMRPGHDCIACHDRGDGPSFLVAGTVHPAEGIDDPHDCLGIPGASVLVEDAAGHAFSLETNDAGNFWLARGSGPLTFPLRVELEYDTVMQPMALQPEVGACASCHTAEGLDGALGRIILP
jgi:hypothetical protein